MSNRLRRTAALLLVPVLLAVLAFGTALTAGAAALYQNDASGYRAVILDDAGLLSEEDAAEVLQSMQPLTAYGSVALWTTRDYAVGGELEQAMNKRIALFGFSSSTIFVINMNNRKLTIQSDGALNDSITDSWARSVTNNVKGEASAGNYAACAEKAFAQMLDLVQGRAVSEPMKYFSFAVLALMAGLIAVLAFAFSKKANPLVEETPQFATAADGGAFCQSVAVKVSDSPDGKSSSGKSVAVSVLYYVLSLVLDILLSGGGSGGGGSSGGGGGGGGRSGGGSGGSSSF